MIEKCLPWIFTACAGVAGAVLLQSDLTGLSFALMLLPATIAVFMAAMFLILLISVMFEQTFQKLYTQLTQTRSFATRDGQLAGTN